MSDSIISPAPGTFARIALGAALATALAGCGSSTGDLPIGADASGGDDPATGAFGDPALAPDGTNVTSSDTLGADVSDRAPVPNPGAALADPVSAGPFETPDPAAATLVGRLGRGTLVDLADTLSAARFVDDYLAVDEALFALVAADGVQVAPDRESFDCPDGGQVRVGRDAGSRDGVLALAFDACELDGVSLSGSLVRTTTLDGFRFGTSEMLALDYRELRVDAGGARATTLTGTTRRDVTRRVDTVCGGEDVDLGLVHRIETASVMRDGLTVQVTDARYNLARSSVRETPDGEAASCHERSTSEFEGQARASGGPFGAARAELRRSGAIERDTRDDREPPAMATLLAEIDDGSSLALGLLSDRDGTAQVDVNADGAAVSWTVDYRFAP